MRLAVSNLAWPIEHTDDMLARLPPLGVSGVEVAPTRIAPWEDITPALMADYRTRLADAGLLVSSLQAILFGVPKAQLLGDDAAFEAMAQHLRRVGGIAATLGAGALVFGAPRNRQRGGLGPAAADDLAVIRLRALGAVLDGSGVALGIEPVPTGYGGEFMASWRSVLAIVDAVGHPAIRVHLDTACVAMNGDDIAEAIGACAPVLLHVHAAQPELAAFAPPAENHAAAAAALAAVGYAGWLAIEMRQQPDDPAGAVAAAAQAVRAIYATA